MPRKIEGRKDSVVVHEKMHAISDAAHELLDDYIEALLVNMKALELEEGDSLYESEKERNLKLSARDIMSALHSTLETVAEVAQAAESLGFGVPDDLRILGDLRKSQ